MPPRKSNVSNLSAEDGGSTPAKGDGFGVEDLNLPKTMVQRLAKGVLPPNTQIQKDALLAISKSATVFVNYLSSHANEQAARLNKKTIQPKDVMDAIHDIEFDNFLPRLEAELQKYNTVQCDKRNTYRRKVREEQKAKKMETSEISISGPSGSQDGENGANGATGASKGDSEPASKKIRRENGEAAADEDDEDGEGMVDEEGEGDDDQDDEDEDDEDDDEGEGEDTFEDAREELAEDPLEDREGEDEEMEDEVLDGEESD